MLTSITIFSDENKFELNLHFKTDGEIPSESLNEFPFKKIKSNSQDLIFKYTLAKKEVDSLLQKLVNKDPSYLLTPTEMDETVDILARFLPPPPPETVIKGFDSEGYWPLIQSLSAEDRIEVLNELKSKEVIERAKTMLEELKTSKPIISDTQNCRTLFLAGLFNLQQKKMTINQVASLHILDSATRSLYTHLGVYLMHNFLNKNTTQVTSTFFTATADEFTDYPRAILPLHYKKINTNTKIKIEELPTEMQKPLIQRFFNFNKSEWACFCEEIDKAPYNEQLINILIAPEFGCWSAITFRIQRNLKCMRMLECNLSSDDGMTTKRELVMVTPTFSMFQAALNAKAKCLKRNSVQLIPTYYYLNADAYATYKSVGCIPLTMYLPEKSPHLQYKKNKGRFRQTIDGHDYETSFAGAIHDVYHGFREITMSEQVALARWRLITIAKSHPKNKKSAEHKAIDEILIDGELLYSYDQSADTIFEPSYRQKKQIWGDIFYCTSVKDNLTDELKLAFIKDMVINKEEWFENFGLGKQDLRSNDQTVYEELEAVSQEYSNRYEMKSS